MTSGDKAALAVAAVFVLIVLVAVPGVSALPPRAIQGAVEGVSWNPQNPAGHEHLARPGDIGGVLWGPHPVYCDPGGPGPVRDPLIARGWADWMTDPPSEETI